MNINHLIKNPNNLRIGLLNQKNTNLYRNLQERAQDCMTHQEKAENLTPNRKNRLQFAEIRAWKVKESVNWERREGEVPHLGTKVEFNYLVSAKLDLSGSFCTALEN